MEAATYRDWLMEENHSTNPPLDAQPPPPENKADALCNDAPAGAASETGGDTAPKPQIIDPKPEPAQPMEVHHHPHQQHSQSNWKSYLREFLMLFLAVFCGFLAEYQLEHRIEREREKKYIRSMVNDLKYDTANFTRLIHDGKVTMALIDSLIAVLNTPQNPANTSRSYHIARRITHTITPYEIFDRTYAQMKSSGNLRLLKSQEAGDHIAGYYSDIPLLQSQQGFIQSLLLDYIREVTAVFDGAVFHRMYLRTGLTVEDTTNAGSFKYLLQAPEGNPPLLPPNTTAIQQLTGTLHYLYARILSTNSNIRNQRQAAIQLIASLEAQYQLK
jgi:hypothetical protein